MPTAPLALTVPLAAVLLLLAAGLGTVAIRGWQGSLSRAGRFGVRGPASQASDNAFELANRVAAPVLGGGAVVGAVAAALLVIGLPTIAAIVVFGIGFVGLLVLMAWGAGLGERAARTVPLPARKPGGSAACATCASGEGGCSALTRSTAANAEPAA